MYYGKTVTVVLPAYNEEANVKTAIKSFLDIPEVDEVLVVNNNSTDKTKEQAIRAGARVVDEFNQGYGFACRRGLAESRGDPVAIVEPDGTFRPFDLYKFFSYITEFDAVLGSRTNRACIWDGANMNWALRIGNVVVAKMLEYLHNGPCLTDVGCTYKMFTREAIEAVRDYFTVGDSHFSPELMMLCVRRKLRVVEIPVHYQARIGCSKITGDLRKAVKLGFVMIGLILNYRFKHIPPLVDRRLGTNGTATEDDRSRKLRIADSANGSRH